MCLSPVIHSLHQECQDIESCEITLHLLIHGAVLYCMQLLDKKTMPTMLTVSAVPCCRNSHAECQLHPINSCNRSTATDVVPHATDFEMQDELFAGLNCQPGFPCSRQELSQDLKTLLQ